MNTQMSENTLDVSLKLGLSFVISCCITTVFLVYMINAPYILTQQSKMIKEYYYDNAFNSNYVTLKGDEIGSNDSIIFTLSYQIS